MMARAWAQRLSLARALAADPGILVRGRTTVVLTPSPALLDAADWVLVLDDGVIAAEGTHQSLLTTDEGYRLAVAR